MGRNNTVVLACGKELADEVNVGVLESAGFLVIKTSNLDYALVANELFKPKALVLDADQMEGDIAFFCRLLLSRPCSPLIYILGKDKEEDADKALLAACSEYLRKPFSAIELVVRISMGRRDIGQV
jgi:DNA-binding response OmpR family regulator